MCDKIFKLAPAKVNLALSVGAADPTAEGRHPICSWMVNVNLFDELELTRSHPDSMSLYSIDWCEDAPRRSDIDWPITRDLAVRAHLLLEEHLDRRLPLRLKMRKRIPVGSGLGGGSGDAAAMLRACNELFQLEMTTDDLFDLAMQLGSDVGFALKGGSALVEGFGERLKHVPHREEHLVLIFPEQGCPTGEVYRAFDDISKGRVADRNRVQALVDQPLSEDAPFNDLKEPACIVNQDLNEVLRDVSALAESPAHLTGSGSAVFVVCSDSIHAEALALAITDRLNLPARPVRTLADLP